MNSLKTCNGRVGRRLALLICLLGIPAAVAAPQFPTLTGRVVDQAGLLSEAATSGLEQLLARHETETSNQVVVVTLTSLQGYDIADYGYQLGRHWGIGQKQRDNGVILIVAPAERRVRIEVGYGLEGVLTDALSNNIIQTQILPPFRQQKYEAGIVAGVQAILAAIAGSYEPIEKSGDESLAPVFVFLLFMLLFLLMVYLQDRRNYAPRNTSHDGFIYLPPGSQDGGFGGGGFGGGGGSFGGGGSSGGW